jgi:hypothetical protein
MLGIQEHASRLWKVIGEIDGSFVGLGWARGGLGLAVGLLVKQACWWTGDAIGRKFLDEGA